MSLQEEVFDTISPAVNGVYGTIGGHIARGGTVKVKQLHLAVEVFG
jgi:hypothetical protein